MSKSKLKPIEVYKKEECPYCRDVRGRSFFVSDNHGWFWFISLIERDDGIFAHSQLERECHVYETSGFIIAPSRYKKVVDVSEPYEIDE